MHTDPEQRTSLRCKVLGHKIDADVVRYYAHYHCRRCDFHSPDHINAESGMLPQIHLWINHKKYSLESCVAWFRPCADCGRRFGRHDKLIDHLPF